MINNILKRVSKGGLRKKFLLLSTASIIIMFCGINYSLSVFYEKSTDGIINRFNQAFVQINKFVNKKNNSCEAYLNKVCMLEKVKGAILDNDGKIIMKSKNIYLDRMDMQIIEKVLQGKHEDGNTYQLYEIRLDDDIYNLLIWDEEYRHKYVQKRSIIIVIACAILAILNIYIFAIRKVKYINELTKGVDNFSNGNLDYNIPKRGRDELSFLASGMNSMAKNLKTSMETQKYQEQFKAELITSVSHDLRTPLTSLIGYLQLLEDEKITEVNRKKYTEICIEKAYKLRTLIGDLFEYSKLGCGGVVLEKSHISIIEIIEQSIGELYIEGKNRNMTFKKEYLNGNINLYVDSNKIGRVFENLLSNAVKYGVENSSININIVESEETIIISFENAVAEENCGDIEKVFQRFYRGDASRNSSIAGSGLGLAIAKNIVTLHEGDIWVESKNNKFKVYVKLPKVME